MRRADAAERAHRLLYGLNWTACATAIPSLRSSPPWRCLCAPRTGGRPGQPPAPVAAAPSTPAAAARAPRPRIRRRRPGDRAAARRRRRRTPRAARGESRRGPLPEAQPGGAAAAAGRWFRAPRHARSRQAWVAAANPLAVEAGLEILGKGGKALDAAVAVQAMLGTGRAAELRRRRRRVPALLRRAHRQGERASTGARRPPPPPRRTCSSTSTASRCPSSRRCAAGARPACPGRSACSPPRTRKLGALHWKELFEPAIRAASQGFRVPARLAMFLGEGSPFPPTNEIRTLFSRPDGEILQEGRPVPEPRVCQDPAAHRRGGPARALPGHDRLADGDGDAPGAAARHADA